MGEGGEGKKIARSFSEVFLLKILKSFGKRNKIVSKGQSSREQGDSDEIGDSLSCWSPWTLN